MRYCQLTLSHEYLSPFFSFWFLFLILYGFGACGGGGKGGVKENGNNHILQASFIYEEIKFYHGALCEFFRISPSPWKVWVLGAECWELILHGSHISAHCMSRGTDRLVLDIFLFLDIIQQTTLEERDNVSLRAKDVIKNLDSLNSGTCSSLDVTVSLP